MPRRYILVAGIRVGFSLAALHLVAGAKLYTQGNEYQAGRESVLDHIVHVESELLLEVPATPRWEDQLDLTVRRVPVGDAELHVEEEGSGIPMVLINGGPGGTHHGFHPWFSRARSFARVVYYDQRGCGLSDYEPGEAGYSVDQAVADLEALRVALGIDSWVLVGFSYGGLLAQYYTTKHPEHVRGMVLVGASPGMWTDLGADRQYDHISSEERERLQAIRSQLRQLRADEGWSHQQYERLAVYNNYLNGDWKRQHFYRPSAEEMARIALYGWVQDASFSGAMNYSASMIDLTGAFNASPVPTLILEGKWDFTWGDQKPTVLSRNHPNARMMVIEGAAHSIFDENPEAFFRALEDFLSDLPPVSPSSRERFAQSLAEWRARWTGSLDYRVLPWDWGIAASRELAHAYVATQLDGIRRLLTFQRIGFALYDVARYEDALHVFAALEDAAAARTDLGYVELASIWQGHMLDLLGRRSEALGKYQRVLELGYESGTRHDQYGMDYSYLPYAAERLAIPFERIENGWP